jgi:hypothetical protein
MPTAHDDLLATVPPVYGKSTFRVGDPLPVVLTARELGAILGYSPQRSSELKKAGAFDLFENLPRVGLSPRYSGKKVQQWLDGDLDIQRGRFFGSRRGNR